MGALAVQGKAPWFPHMRILVDSHGLETRPALKGRQKGPNVSAADSHSGYLAKDVWEQQMVFGFQCYHDDTPFVTPVSSTKEANKFSNNTNVTDFY